MVAAAAAAVGRKNRGPAPGRRSPAAGSPAGWCLYCIPWLCHSHHSTAAAGVAGRLQSEKDVCLNLSVGLLICL